MERKSHQLVYTTIIDVDIGDREIQEFADVIVRLFLENLLRPNCRLAIPSVFLQFQQCIIL